MFILKLNSVHLLIFVLKGMLVTVVDFLFVGVVWCLVSSGSLGSLFRYLSFICLFLRFTCLGLKSCVLSGVCEW